MLQYQYFVSHEQASPGIKGRKHKAITPSLPSTVDLINKRTTFRKRRKYWALVSISTENGCKIQVHISFDFSEKT